MCLLNLLFLHMFTAPSTLAINKFNSPFTDGGFVSIVSRRQKSRGTTVTEKDAQGHEGNGDIDGDDKNPQLFGCPLEGCVLTYQRYSSLQRHLDCGKCKLKEERETLYDKAKKLYTDKLVAGVSAHPFIATKESLSSDAPAENLPRGWALKESKKGRRFSEKQKMYLDEMFDKGKRSGHKIDPAIVAKEMHFAKDFDGN